MIRLNAYGAPQFLDSLFRIRRHAWSTHTQTRCPPHLRFLSDHTVGRERAWYRPVPGAVAKKNSERGSSFERQAVGTLLTPRLNLQLHIISAEMKAHRMLGREGDSAPGALRPPYLPARSLNYPQSARGIGASNTGRQPLLRPAVPNSSQIYSLAARASGSAFAEPRLTEDATPSKGPRVIVAFFNKRGKQS